MYLLLNLGIFQPDMLVYYLEESLKFTIPFHHHFSNVMLVFQCYVNSGVYPFPSIIWEVGALQDLKGAMEVVISLREEVRDRKWPVDLDDCSIHSGNLT